MRVALVAETFTPAVNGVVNSVLRTAEELCLRGHDPVVIAPSGTAFAAKLGRTVEVVRVPSVALPGYSGLRVARPGLNLLATLADVEPDIVHLASPAVLGWSAARAARELQVPVVASFQTDLAAFARRNGLRVGAPGLVWAALRRVHALAAVTLAPSSSTAYLLRRNGIGPIVVIPRGVDARLFTPSAREPALRSSLLRGRRLLVGVVGRLAPEKRIDLLAETARLPGVSMVVVGDGPERAKLERRLPEARFLGRRTGPELAAIMAGFDLLIHPGADETFCQVVQESLACGVPVVAAASGGPLDLVQHGSNGWLWAGNDPRVLAAMVEGLVADPGSVAAAATRARPSVRGRTWGAVTGSLLEVYGQVAPAAATAGRLVS
jgi:phosphatidylinositol alpha 1,6-mannosyltransferase